MEILEKARTEEAFTYNGKFFQFGAYPHTETMKMMDRFVRDVAPHFR